MSKARRLTSIAALGAAATVAVSGAAFAADSTPYQDDADRMVIQHDDYSNTSHLFRVAGPSRVNTAIKLNNSSDKWADGARTAIIARDDDFADALASGPLADVLDAPLYISAPGSAIDGRVTAELKAKGVKNVYLIGGTGVFTEGARAQLEGMGINVHRQRGVDRYETAVGIAKKTIEVGLDNDVTKKDVNVYLATGTDFPDALAAGAAASDNDGIVLLTKNTELEKFTYRFLVQQWDDLYPDEQGIEIHTVGGQAEKAAKSRLEDIADTNTGKNRYATAVMLANKFKHNPDKIAVTSGENYPDGVVSGAWVANHDGPLVLTRNAALSPETAAYVGQEHIADGNADIVVVGGTGSVSQNVSDQLAAIMTW